jgi:hypothetical protein
MPVPRAWAGALAIVALSAATVAVAGPASAGATSIAHFKPRAVINYHPAAILHSAALSPRLAGGLPTFTAKQTDGAKTFKFTMVGKNPRAKQTTPSTTVPTEIVPLKLEFADSTVSDPTVGNGCDSTPALTRTMNSPVVKNEAWSFGGTKIGTTQYVDAFQRSEFWKYVKPGALNPGYHVKLAFKAVPVQTIVVPAADSAEGTTTCGLEWAMEINWLIGYLQKTLLPSLRTQGLVGPNNFPMFLVNNTVEYVNTTANCCVLGFHSAFSVNGGTQTYGISDFDNGGAFGTAIRDIEVASHEIAEWMDDPVGTNPTKPWGNIGQVSGCQTNLEVGDPLTGSTLTRKVGTFSYHMQELAFFSWFYHQKPSIGVHGWYSNKGTFKTPAAACP